MGYDESPHPQMEWTPNSVFLVVPDGPCFDGGVDVIVGPYLDEDAAWKSHDSLSPWPCRTHRDPPSADAPLDVRRARMECDCVALPAMNVRGPVDPLKRT